MSKSKKTFLVVYKILNATSHCYAQWDGTIQGIEEIKLEIFETERMSSPVYIEIKAMIECFGEPAQ